MKIINLTILACILTLLSIPLTAKANTEDYDWRKIDRIGLYDKKSKKQIKRNIWKDYTQNEAVKALNNLPTRLTSSTYRELATRLLLSEASPSKEDITSPLLLAKRLEKLIYYGLFDEATELYQQITQNESLPVNFELSLINIQLTLTNGSLAPICLDVQASSAAFRDMPAWRELSDFCRLRFGSAEKIKMNELKFTHFPDFKNILQSDNVSISDLTSNLGTLIAFGDKRVSKQSYDNQARNINELPDLVIKLALKRPYSTNETYQCYAIEAVKRGIINIETLAKIYENAEFNDTALEAHAGEIALHPCDVPAYFYQLLNKADNEDKPTLINAMILTTESVPAQALSPMARLIKDYASDKSSPWRSSVILAVNDIPVSDSLLPLAIIQKQESLKKDTYLTWLKTDKNDLLLKDKSIDLAAPHYILQTLATKNINFTDSIKNKKYGNFFSLTYAKKSLGLGLGFNDFIAKAYDNDNHVLVITQLLGAVGHRDVQNMHPDVIAVILSGLKAYKLEKEAVATAFEYLQ